MITKPDTEANAGKAETSKDWFFSWKGIVLTISILMTLIALAFFHDEELLDDSDFINFKETSESQGLKELRALIPLLNYDLGDPKSGGSYYIHEDNLYYDAKKDKRYEDFDIFSDMNKSLKNKKTSIHWTTKQITDLINQNQKTFDQFNRIVQKKAITLDSSLDQFTAESNEIILIKEMILLTKLKTNYLFSANQQEAAIKNLINSFKIIQKPIVENGLILHCFVEMACQKALMENLKSSIIMINKKENIKKLKRQLLKTNSTDRHFSESLKYEYRAIKNFLSNIGLNKTKHLSYLYDTPSAYIFKLYYRENKTKNLLYKEFLHTYKESKGDYTYIAPSDLKVALSKQIYLSKSFKALPPKPTPTKRRTHKYLKYLNHNFFGELMINEWFKITTNLSRKGHRCETLKKHLLIALAIREYYLDQGKEAETLAQLVPEYLEAIPLEPATNRPFQYSKERKLICLPFIDLSKLPKVLNQEERKVLTQSQVIFELPQ